MFQIQANSKKNFDSMIAIDDLKLSGCEVTPYCLTDQFTCPTGSCLRMDQVCDFTQQCGNGEDEDQCGAGNFKSDMNGWLPNPDSDGDWDRTTGQDGFKDHSAGTGRQRSKLLLHNAPSLSNYKSNINNTDLSLIIPTHPQAATTSRYRRSS